jgi:pyruvate/2-oxoglutarate dehydrogenase complex dihydrolipoamide acyltransferase (E2) component
MPRLTYTHTPGRRTVCYPNPKPAPKHQVRVTVNKHLLQLATGAFAAWRAAVARRATAAALAARLASERGLACAESAFRAWHGAASSAADRAAAADAMAARLRRRARAHALGQGFAAMRAAAACSHAAAAAADSAAAGRRVAAAAAGLAWWRELTGRRRAGRAALQRMAAAADREVVARALTAWRDAVDSRRRHEARPCLQSVCWCMVQTCASAGAQHTQEGGAACVCGSNAGDVCFRVSDERRAH